MKKSVLALLICFILVLGCSAAFAEGTLTVDGKGTVLMDADQVSVCLGVNLSGEDVAEVQDQANSIINAIHDKLIEMGLDEKDISTNYLYINPRYDYSGEMEWIIGYTVNSTLTICTKDIDNIGSYIDAAFDAGANTFESIAFSLTDDVEAKEKALELAVGNAQGKAKAIAGASGCRLTGLVSIKENSDYSYYNYDSYTTGARVYAMEEADTAAATNVLAAQISVSAAVQLVYSFEEAE